MRQLYVHQRPEDMEESKYRYLTTFNCEQNQYLYIRGHENNIQLLCKAIYTVITKCISSSDDLTLRTFISEIWL